MADKSWKAFERRIAKRLGGVRRGSDFRGKDGGKDDIIHPTLSVECKLLGRPSYSDLQKACDQAETNSPITKIPVAIVKKKNVSDDNALVIIRLQTFEEAFRDFLELYSKEIDE